jgi:hypothetical protein
MKATEKKIIPEVFFIRLCGSGLTPKLKADPKVPKDAF